MANGRHYLDVRSRILQAQVVLLDAIELLGEDLPAASAALRSQVAALADLERLMSHMRNDGHA